jgi:hypothetical protein
MAGGCLLIAASAFAAPPPVVPTEAVLDRTDNPTGDYVVCIQRDHWTSGVPDGPCILCLVKAPRM